MTGLPDPRHFTIHDVGDFPIVRARADAVRPGYGPDWVREMERLVNGPMPFAILHAGPQPDEDHDDFTLRGIWMKVNAARLAARCRAVVRVEPDTGRREAMLAQTARLQKAFGVPMEVAATEAEAEARAHALCAERA